MPISPLSLAGATFVPPDAGAAVRPTGVGAAPFADLVDHFVGGAVRNGVEANQAVRDLALGKTDNLHEMMLQVAQADLSFHLILEMRNRLTDAYQEIMKMQV